ncbi:MAG: hypothetical protein JWM11_5897 [Planctomycetaceae bacterium]|nr:hypothetical protein [Planctomycetaceae bacterium]
MQSVIREVFRVVRPDSQQPSCMSAKLFVVSRCQRRCGATLILVVILLFAILALAGLVIDVGLARLARRQMQTAVDAAALEGLRFSTINPAEDGIPQDLSDTSGPPPTSGFDPTSPDWKVWLNRTRRIAAKQAAARQVGDISLPIAPEIKFANGIPLADGFYASQDLIPTSGNAGDPRYGSVLATKPLELNLDDNQKGDMVQGTYEDGQSVRHIEYSDVDPDHTAYDRDDFQYAVGSDAFLVRMRRTNEQELPDVMSVDSPLPYLFARGSLLASKSKANGISVRATAIAATTITRLNSDGSVDGQINVGNAKSAGSSNPSLNLPGITPFAISSAEWNTGTTFTALWFGITTLAQAVDESATTLVVAPDMQGFPSDSAFTIQIDSELIEVAPTTGNTTWTIQRGSRQTTVSAHAQDSTVYLHIDHCLSIGQPSSGLIYLGMKTLTIPTMSLQVQVYVPLTESIGGQDMIVGFGRIKPDWSVNNALISLNQVEGNIAVVNASNSIVEPFSAAISPIDVAQLVIAHQGLMKSLKVTLLTR